MGLAHNSSEIHQDVVDGWCLWNYIISLPVEYQVGSFCNFLWCNKCCMKREGIRQQENCIVDYPHRNSKPAGLMFLCVFVHVCCLYYGIILFTLEQEYLMLLFHFHLGNVIIG